MDSETKYSTSILKEKMAGIKSQCICLSSEANKNLFPSNTSSSFINQLPNIIWNKENQKIYMRLLAVALPIHLPGVWSEYSYLKIHVYEVESQREGLEYTHGAGGFPFPPLQKCSEGYAMHTFSHAPLLLLRFQQIDKLHIRLTDEQDKNVKLPKGPATLVWVEITTDMEDSEYFTTTCLSYQPLTHPSNNLVTFRTPFSTPLTLPDHEVALLQLVYPPNMTEESMVTLRVGNYLWEYDLDYIDTAQEFISKVNIDIRNSIYYNDLNFTYWNGHNRNRGKVIFIRRIKKIQNLLLL